MSQLDDNFIKMQFISHDVMAKLSGMQDIKLSDAYCIKKQINVFTAFYKNRKCYHYFDQWCTIAEL